MINLKETLKKNNITAYRLAQLINRPSSQVYGWLRGIGFSPLMEEKIRTVCAENSIDIAEK